MRAPESTVRLATRFALACAATVTVLVFLAGLGFLRLARGDVLDDVDALLRAQAARLRPVAVRTLAAAGAAGRRAGPHRAAAGSRCTATADGSPTASTRSCPACPARGTGPRTVIAGGQRWRAVVVNVPSADGLGGRLWVFAARGEPERELDRLRLRVGVVTLIALPVAGLVGWLVGRAATRPLRRLQHRLATLPTARRVGGGSGVPEIDEVAAVVDTTLDRYDGQVALTSQALQAARSFAASAAHELRTPLAGIGTNLEVLQRHEHIDPAERDEILADLLAEHRRAVGLLAMLRVLAANELITPEQFERVDLADLVDSAADAARRRHPHAEITVTGPPAVHGQRLAGRVALHRRQPARQRRDPRRRPGDRPGGDPRDAGPRRGTVHCGWWAGRPGRAARRGVPAVREVARQPGHRARAGAGGAAGGAARRHDRGRPAAGRPVPGDASSEPASDPDVGGLGAHLVVEERPLVVDRVVQLPEQLEADDAEQLDPGAQAAAQHVRRDVRADGRADPLDRLAPRRRQRAVVLGGERGRARRRAGGSPPSTVTDRVAAGTVSCGAW